MPGHTRQRTRGRRGIPAAAALVILVVIALMVGPDADAAGTNGWAVEPSGPDGPGRRSVFVYDMKPGQSLQDTVAVTNATDQTLRIELYPRDALSTTESGAVAYQQKAEPPVDAGAWIALAVSEYVLPPGTRADIAFTITVPGDAAPGDHVAGIIGGTVSSPEADPSAPGVQVEQRIAARVYIRVDGPVTPGLEVDDVDLVYDNGAFAMPGGGTATVAYTVRNTGDVRLSPDAVVTLRDPLGRVMAESPAARLPELLPGGDVRTTYRFDRVTSAVRLTTEVRATTIGLNPASATGSASVWAVPWLVVAPLSVLALTAVGVWWHRRRARRRSAVSPV